MIVSLALLSTARAQSTDKALSEISVSANASVTAEPDVAEFRVSIVTRQEQATAAFKAYLGTYDALQRSLRGIVDTTKLYTDNLSVTPHFNYKKPEQVTPDYYQVTAAMSLSVPISDLNKVLGRITSVDGVTINGIEFQSKEQDELEIKALKLATEKARDKAEAIAKLEGLSDLKVKSMTTSTTRPPIMPMYRTMAAEAVGPSVNPSSISVSASISATYTAVPK